MTLIQYQAITKQKGAALIVLVLAFIMATSVLLISEFSIDKGRINFEKKTSESLARAKEALISYAVSYYELTNAGEYGYLPCVENNGIGEGVESGNCEGKNRHAIGRLPWKTLDIKPLKDGSGECLWYAVTGTYKNVNNVTKTDMLNEDTVGMFQIKDENNNMLKGNIPEQRVVALVIAPGAAVAGQNRPAAAPPPGLNCKVSGNDAFANMVEYLELVGLNNNASFDDPLFLDTFVTALNQQNQNTNDRIISITQNEIYDRIKKSQKYNQRMIDLTHGLALCVDAYINNNPAVTGGACNTVVCPSCNANICKSQCRADRTACRNQCDIDRLACLAAGGSNKVCNNARKACRDACGVVENTCNANCDVACAAGGGGGGNNFWLPFPAPVDLLADYRLNSSYVENGSIVGPGRLPLTINNPADTNPTATLFDNCANIDLDGNPVTQPNINFTDTNDEYRLLWENWKDHIFYIIGSGFEPTNAPATATPTDCNATPAQCIAVFDGAATSYYAALVIFSGSRNTTPGLEQFRRAAPPEPLAPLAAESKADYSNYLDAYNTGANRFEFTTGQDWSDIAYCIDENRNIALCPTL